MLLQELVQLNTGQDLDENMKSKEKRSLPWAAPLPYLLIVV
jgi:hypothetical protein